MASQKATQTSRRYIPEDGSIWMLKWSLCLTNYAQHHAGLWWSGCVDLSILSLEKNTSSRFTPRPLYLPGRIPRYAFDRRLSWPQSCPGRHGEVRTLDPSGSRTPTHLPFIP
jgi:hypothetical protein